MTAQSDSRLATAQAELTRRGVVDVRFTLNPEFAGSREELADDVANMLEAYLRGEGKVIEAIDDMLPPSTEDRELEDLARSSFEGAMASGVDFDAFRKLAFQVAATVRKAEIAQRQGLLPLLNRVGQVEVRHGAPLVTLEVIHALCHARSFGQQPCENPADSLQLKKASSALLGSVNAAWRSLGLRPPIPEAEAVAALGFGCSAADSKVEG